MLCDRCNSSLIEIEHYSASRNLDRVLVALRANGVEVLDDGLRLVPPIDGSEKAVDAQFGLGHGGFLPRSQSAQSRLRKEG
jgi:hypothetical protein